MSKKRAVVAGSPQSAGETVARVQVVYALAEVQHIVDLDYRDGMTAADAVAASGFLATFPEIGARPLVLGVFGRPVERSSLLSPGDRVEICRPLAANPRDRRRRFAAEGKVMRAERGAKG